jgi:hypothetical protein
VAISLANVATQDKYVDALTLGPIAECVGIKYVVANASVLAQTVPKSKSGTLPDWGDEVLITPESNTLQDCDGIRFRSATAGVPAQVVATLYLPADAKFGSGTPFTSKLSAAGAISGQVSTVLTGATIAALNTAAGSALVDGIPGRLQLGAAPFDFVDVVYNAALAKWVTAEDWYEMGQEIGGSPQVGNAFVELVPDTGSSGIVPTPPLIPWAALDAAGLKGQMRGALDLSNDGSGIGTTSSFRLGLRGAPLGAALDAVSDFGAASQLDGSNASPSHTVGDTGWKDFPAVTVRTFVAPAPLVKATTLGRGAWLHVTVGVRWLG